MLLQCANRSHALLYLGASRVERSRASRAEERHRSPYRREEPEQHVRQIDPDGVLHPCNAALFGSRVLTDVHVAEEAEECCPEDADMRVLV